MSDVVFAKPQKKEETLSLLQQCQRFIDYVSLIPDVREKYINPLLIFYKVGTDPLVFGRRLLQQGGVLCEIINVLKENIIPEIKGWPQPVISNSDFMHLEKTQENLKTFLDVCRTDLYMTDEQLFLLDDIFKKDTTSLATVIKTALNLLSRIKTVGKINFPKRLKEIPEEKLITTLLVGEAAPEEEEVGNKTKVLKGTQLEHIITEIQDTERIYVNDLDKFQEYKKEALFSKLFSKETIEGIFLNLDELVEVQRRFLLKMESCLSQRYLEDMKIGELFVSAEEDFHCYESFCSKYSRASSVVKQEEKKLKKVGPQGIENPVREFNSFLIKPTQRICKYPLLLRELLKTLPNDYSQRAEIQSGFESVTKITTRVNETQRVQENILKAAEIASEVDNPTLGEKSVVGSLCLHGKAFEIIDSKEKERLFVLYEKRLIVYSETKSGLVSFTKRELSKYTTKKYIEIGEINKILLLPSESSPNTLRITFDQEKGEEVLDIKFKTHEEAQRWSGGLEDLKQRKDWPLEDQLADISDFLLKVCILDETYLLSTEESNQRTLEDFKKIILETVIGDPWLWRRKHEELNSLPLNPTGDEMDEMRLYFKDHVGDWVALLSTKDLERLRKGKKEFTVKLVL